MRFASLIVLLFASIAPAQSVTLPTEKRIRAGAWSIVAPSAVDPVDGALEWEIDAGLEEQNLSDLLGPDLAGKLRGKVISGNKAGRFAVRCWTAKMVGGKAVPSKIATCWVIVGDVPPVPPGPEVSYTITATDGGSVPFAPPYDLAAAKNAANAYAAAHPGVTVTVRDSKGAAVYIALTPLPSPAPIPIDGFRVLIVYETADLAKYPVGQVESMRAQVVRQYLSSKCAKGPDGKAEWRAWDQNVDASGESKLWQDAFNRKPASKDKLPWILISDGKKGYEGTLPMTVEKTLELLKQFGGP